MGESRAGGWDSVADWYDRLLGEQGSDYHRNVIIPAALRMLDVAPGHKVLDLCCGQGVFARALQAEGVEDVLGVDISPQLIAAAQRHASGSGAQGGYRGQQGRRHPGGPGPRSSTETRRTGKHGAAARSQGMPTQSRRQNTEHGALGASARFLVGDATKGGTWADGSFDRVACIMAAHDVEDVAGLCRTAAAALKASGRFMMILVHPCFRVPRQSSWGWDEQKRMQYRRIDRYAEPLKIPIATHPGRGDSPQTLFFHRPLADYINALGAAGLAVVACEEPLSHRRAAPGGRSRGENRAAAEFPIFLALAAVRMPTG